MPEWCSTPGPSAANEEEGAGRELRKQIPVFLHSVPNTAFLSLRHYQRPATSVYQGQCFMSSGNDSPPVVHKSTSVPRGEFSHFWLKLLIFLGCLVCIWASGGGKGCGVGEKQQGVAQDRYEPATLHLCLDMHELKRRWRWKGIPLTPINSFYWRVPLVCVQLPHRAGWGIGRKGGLTCDYLPIKQVGSRAGNKVHLIASFNPLPLPVITSSRQKRCLGCDERRRSGCEVQPLWIWRRATQASNIYMHKDWGRKTGK